MRLQHTSGYQEHTPLAATLSFSCCCNCLSTTTSVLELCREAVIIYLLEEMSYKRTEGGFHLTPDSKSYMIVHRRGSSKIPATESSITFLIFEPLQYMKTLQKMIGLKIYKNIITYPLHCKCHKERNFLAIFFILYPQPQEHLVILSRNLTSIC